MLCFLVDDVDFDQIDDQVLIGIFVKDLFGNRIGNFFLKIGIGA